MFFLTYIKGTLVNEWVITDSRWLIRQIQGGIPTTDERLEQSSLFVHQEVRQQHGKGRCTSPTEKRIEDEGRGYWHVHSSIWRIGMNGWLLLRWTLNHQHIHSRVTPQPVPMNFQAQPTLNLWPMERCGCKKTATIHPHTSTNGCSQK